MSKVKSEEQFLLENYQRAKPCPFCGSKKLAVHCDCSVYCLDCEAQGPTANLELFDMYQNAFEKWNNRSL